MQYKHLLNKRKKKKIQKWKMENGIYVENLVNRLPIIFTIASFHAGKVLYYYTKKCIVCLYVIFEFEI